jgi:ABC-type branched-subunit amino acid transport system substrate-binding protein
MRPPRPGIVRAAAAVLVVSLVASGCTANQPATPDPLGPSADQIFLYGTDGNMLNGVGALVKDYPSGLAGMKGTAPLTRLSQTFRSRLRAIDSGLKDDLYAGETYDAVVISALAAQVAKTTSPTAIAGQINGVTTGGQTCESVAECFSLIAQGKDIAYKGISLRLGGFTDAGEPSAGTYGILRFAGNNTLDDSLTEFIQAGDPAAVTKKAPPAPGAPGPGEALAIGGLLPKTGALGEAGPPMFAALKLAIDDVNHAGGVLGKPVRYVDGDDGTDPDVAKKTVQRLVSEGVQVIIGAGASSISLAVLPQTVAAGVVLFSPCNTSAELTDADDKGLYFRTAPPDGLQATALTDMIMRDGVRRLVIVARDDSYGQGLMDSVRKDLLKAGLSDADVKTIPYDQNKADFSSLGGVVKDFAPDGVLIVGFDESADAATSIMKAGLKSRLM